jgi:hypothetical protein
MNQPIELFHFRTLAALVIVSLLGGFFGAFVPFLMVVLAAAITMLALKSIISPAYLGSGRFALPIGRLDALLWLSVAPVFALVGLAMMHGLPPTAYLGGHST